MLKLLCFISLAVVSVSASLPAGPCRIMNNKGNVLKLPNMTSLQVVSGPLDDGLNSPLQMWQLKPISPKVYAIMPMATELIGSLMTFNNTGPGGTLQNGDNAVVREIEDTEDPKPEFQWTIDQTDSTSEYYTITRINPSGNFNVDLAGGSTQDGAKVQAYQSTVGNVNQLWKFV